MSQDIIKATIDLLTADTAVLALVNGEVVAIFGGELPKSFHSKMENRQAILIRRAPGGGGGANVGGYQELEEQELEIYAFAPTPKLADDLYRVINSALKQARRQVQNSALLHSYKLSAPAQSDRDPDQKWPFVLSSWLLLASETAAS